MLTDVAFLIAGLGLIIKGGDFFVAAAVRIAEILRLPHVVIGSTLVSLTTTMPEMVVSLVSGLEGEPGLGVGNAIGSVICNIGLVLGVTAAMRRVELHLRALLPALSIMLAVGVLLFLFSLDLRLSPMQGGFLLLVGAIYFSCDFALHLRRRPPPEIAEAKAIEREMAATRWAWLETPTGTGVQFMLGATLVALGSKLLVDGAVGAAARLGIPSMVVGLTVVALGTSLPELTTAVTSSRRAVSDLAVGNVLGANIANLTLVVGTAAVVQDARMERLTQLFNFPAMLFVMLLLVVMMWSGGALDKRDGWILIGVYLTYLVVVAGLALAAS